MYVCLINFAVVAGQQEVLNSWVLSTAKAFVKDSAMRHARPKGKPGSDFPFVKTAFNDDSWRHVDLPLD